MAMTMTQKILAAHAGLPQVTAGQLITVPTDMVLGNDITTPVAIREFRRCGREQVFDREKIAIVLDHFTPNKDIKAAEQCKVSREFAREMGIVNFFDVGQMGIEHALLPDKGLVKAGDIVIGADSHTCTYGALNAFSTGVGSTDMGCAMALGRTWLKVPSAIKVELTGALRPYVSGKDLILHLIGEIGVDGALYQSLEFVGDGVASLSMDDRFAICNMAIEAGAKNGIFPADEKTKAYLAAHARESGTFFAPDPDAEYTRTVHIDLDKLDFTVAFPHLPGNAHVVREISEKIAIQQCIIGSCTNGRLEDIKAAAEILRGRKVAKGVRAIVIPATQKIYLEAIEKGYVQALVKAGCAVSTPTCGPCLGGHMGILASGEAAISTTNRNFVGRMGHVDSKVYLASPAVAAASAVKGYIASPEDL